MINRWGNYLVSGALSGYIVLYGLNLFIREMSLIERWSFVQEYRVIDILLMWEIQFILAVIIFSFAIFYLTREITRKDTLQ